MSKEYNSKEQASIPLQIQKIYTTHLFICISVRSPGETKWIWLGRGRNFKIIQADIKGPSAEIRTKDISVDWLRSRLKNIWLKRFRIDLENGNLYLDQADSNGKIIFGYKDNILHFIDLVKAGNKWKLMSSHRGDSEIVNDEIDIEKIFDSNKTKSVVNLNELNEEWLRNESEKVESKKGKRLKNKILNIDKDIQKLKNYQQIYKDAKNLDLLKDLKEYQENGIRVKFNKSQNMHHKADLLFSKAKAFKAALKIQEKRKKEVEEKYIEADRHSYEKKALSLNWKFSAKKRKEDIPVEIKVKYFENIEMKIAIGLNAKSNDYLRKTWAKKETIWAHIENVTGSHLFLKSNEVPDLKTWKLLGSILKDFSQYNSTEINIVWTKVQYLRPIKGRSGAVRFTKEKRISVNYTSEWMNLLGLRSS